MLALLLSLACSPPPAAEMVSVTNGVSSAEVIDYGNGVYYLDASGMQFGNALSEFIKQHRRTLEVVAVAGDGSSRYGDAGYFIVTRPVIDCN